MDPTRTQRVEQPDQGGSVAPAVHRELEQATAALSRRVGRGRLLLVTLGGSRAYGLDHAGSDVDLRGAWAYPPEALWGLGQPDPTLQVAGCDVVVHELAKLVGGVLSANPNMLESLWGPALVADALVADLLEQRGRLLGAAGLRRSHGGFATGQLRLAARSQGAKRRKALLHTYRVVEQGTRTLREGTVRLAVDPADAERLREWAEQPDMAVHERRLEQLLARLDGVATPLPEEPDRELAERLVVAVRARMLQQAAGD